MDRAFVQRLRELGWIENRTVVIEYRWAEERAERFGEIAAEFVRLKVDVIVTVGSAVAAAMQATSTIPIVFAIAVDPVGYGMVASLARPGGNVLACRHRQPNSPANELNCCGPGGHRGPRSSPQVRH
jgi:putative ABC transport system substrate-binding protein